MKRDGFQNFSLELPRFGGQSKSSVRRTTTARGEGACKCRSAVVARRQRNGSGRCVTRSCRKSRMFGSPSAPTAAPRGIFKGRRRNGGGPAAADNPPLHWTAAVER